jgi:hypothetical protein
MYVKTLFDEPLILKLLYNLSNVTKMWGESKNILLTTSKTPHLPKEI